MKIARHLTSLLIVLLSNTAFGDECYYPGVQQGGGGAVTLYLSVGDSFNCPDLQTPTADIVRQATTLCTLVRRTCDICVNVTYPDQGAIITSVYQGDCGTPGRRPERSRTTPYRVEPGIAP